MLLPLRSPPGYELSQPNHVHHEASQTAPQIPTFVSLWNFKAFIEAWRDHYVLLQTVKAAKAGNSFPSSFQRPRTQQLNATGFARGSCIISSPIFSPKPFATQRAQDTGFPVTDPAFNTSTEPGDTASVLSHTPAFSRPSVSPGSYGVRRAWRLIALSPLPTAPWLPTSRMDVLLCIMLVLRILLTSYITGECTQLPFAGSTRASPIQSTSINRNKDHLISRRQLVSLEVRGLCWFFSPLRKINMLRKFSAMDFHLVDLS